MRLELLFDCGDRFEGTQLRKIQLQGRTLADCIDNYFGGTTEELIDRLNNANGDGNDYYFYVKNLTDNTFIWKDENYDEAEIDYRKNFEITEVEWSEAFSDILSDTLFNEGNIGSWGIDEIFNSYIDYNDGDKVDLYELSDKIVEGGCENAMADGLSIEEVVDCHSYFAETIPYVVESAMKKYMDSLKNEE